MTSPATTAAHAHTLWSILFPRARWHLPVGIVVSALTVWFAWTSPVSPFALSSADAALGQSRPDVAVARYDAAARWNPLPDVRVEALRRAALVWAVELNRPAEAISRLEILLKEDLPPADESAVREEVAHLLVELRKERVAGMAFYKAFEAAPEDPSASRRLVASARTYATLGDAEEAERLWNLVATTFPDQRHTADVGLAELLVARGEDQAALALYERVVAEAADPNLVGLARLGVATCLDRLGDLTEALADGSEEADPRRVEARPGKTGLRGKFVGGR